MTLVWFFAFVRTFVKAGFTSSNIAIDSAMGVFAYYYASRRALNFLWNDYCEVDAKR